MTDPAERRRWIAAHHPDRGGDPETFAAGLARFDRPAPDEGPVTFYRRPRMFVAVVRAVKQKAGLTARRPPRAR